MKIFKNVRGTMVNVPSIEVNVDTVYVRSNIIAIDEEDFKGWQYDEIQYNKDSYIELLSEENKMLDLKNKTLEKELDITNESLFELVMQVYE